MELTWWLVLVAGLACLALAVGAAVLLPMRRRRGGRPLANTTRLTGLPQYRAAVRSRLRATVAALTLLTLVFAAAVLASARPIGSPWTAEYSTPRDDIMLCVGQPVTDATTGRFLGYFARQATTYGTERIGLTSPNRRLIPLTRDYQFAAGRLNDLSGATEAPAQAFSPPVEYSDYAPTVADVLALCITGFPGFDTGSDTRRSLIYLGPGSLRVAGDTRPSLYTDAQVAEMARRAEVQVNAIATPGRETESLSLLTGATAGTFLRLDGSAIDGQLDTIRATPPPGRGGADSRSEDPAVILVAALALAGLLSVALMAVRR